MNTIRNVGRLLYLLGLLIVALLCVPAAIRWNVEGLAAMAPVGADQSAWPLYLGAALLMAACSGAWLEALQARSLSRDILKYKADSDAVHSTLATEVREDHVFWGRVVGGAAGLGATLELATLNASRRPELITVALVMNAILPGLVLYAASRLRTCELLAQSGTEEEQVPRASPLTSPSPSFTASGGVV